MLRSQSILIAKSIADTLSDEGMELVPKAGTPIAFLNAAMASFPYDENKDEYHKAPSLSNSGYITPVPFPSMGNPFAFVQHQ